MKTMMAQAVVLSRSLGDELLTGLPVPKARQALDELKNLKAELPYLLIAEPVREATAAGAGALLGIEEHKREAYIIVDVGAGTTDVAGCYCVNNPEWDRPRVFEVVWRGKRNKKCGQHTGQRTDGVCSPKTEPCSRFNRTSRGGGLLESK
jgi:hypothetical protein